MVNNDNQLAFDMAQDDAMKKLLQGSMNAAGKIPFFIHKLVLMENWNLKGCFLGIDCERIRSNEERLMLRDAMVWTNGASGKDDKCSKFGATALHVAAAKGYTKVLE